MSMNLSPYTVQGDRMVARPGLGANKRHRARPLWSGLPRLGRDDRGSATAFGLFLIVVVLVLAGAMIEGGNAMSARGHATDIAQQAARAGADKLDLAALRNDGLVRIDPAAAQAAATAFLAQVGETGTVTAIPTEVSVTVTVTRPGILVPILGIQTLTVRATATAAPITG
jgi:Flp pilus assembly protein TadG